MTIKKKDGNVYILEGPNKLLKDQENIDLKKCVFHNFSWDEIIYKNKTQTKTTQKVSQPKVIESEVEIKVPKIEVPEAPKTEESEDRTEEFKLPILKVKVLMHCLPMNSKKSVDNLYGESWQKISYGKKFIFPSIMISNNDLQMEFWTSDPRDQINEGSIVYPFSYEMYNQNTESYDKVPFEEYRWWKVSSKEEKENGYLFKTVPSEDHPDFSD